MTLYEALESIKNSSTNDAMKRPGMGGYFFRSEISTTEGSEGDFTLTMRKRENNGGSPVDFVYSYDASTDTWTAPSTKPEMGGEFFGELVASDWQVGKSSDFENARVGDGDEW